ncbi:brevican core protein-like [Xenentodon cancila]
MLLRRNRHVQIFPLLCAVCHLILAFPTQTPPANDGVRQLKVNIPHSGPVFAPLGSSISIPCFVSLSSSPTSSSSTPLVPRVKWTVVSNGVETQILVVRGQRVKINEAYRDRAALFNYTSSPDDLSLWLRELRHSDSGYYRCEVQQGLDDTSDLVQLSVKGVVFHYRDSLGRYAFSFQQAQRACEAIGAQTATPDQLLAAYYDGYEQCDAGWLADQSVRYPIQMPREGCYGDMDGQPGVRNYGTMDPDDLFDVYCYIEQIDGEVFHDPVPQQLTFDEAQSYCRASGAELATTAQLYLAWSEGLDHCSPSWLSDGSVRYPIRTPRDRCGGPQAGVKTVYRFSNQTGFPEAFSLHDVFCFKENRKTSSDSPMDYMATEAEDIGQNVVILMEADQELQLNQQAEQVEREVLSVLESLPFSSSLFTVETPLDTNTTVTSDTIETPFSTTPALDLLLPFNETLDMSYDSQPPTALINTTISSTETYGSPPSTALLPKIYNETDSQQNLTITFHQSEFETTTYDHRTQNQSVPESTLEDTTQPSGKLKQPQEMYNFTTDGSVHPTNNSETHSNHTQESFWETATLVPDLQVKLEEAAVEDSAQVFLTMQTSSKEGTLRAPPTQTTKSPIEALTSSWVPIDGSGDTSKEKDTEVEAATFISASHSTHPGFTTHPSSSSLDSRAPTRHQTAFPDPTLSSGSHHMDKLGLEIISTEAQLWESSSSRQEGSTSLETGEMLNMENEEKQLHATASVDQVVSRLNLVVTESPESLSTSQSPTEYATAQFQTSNYRVYLDAVTNSYEEASGYEPEIFNSTLQEDIEVAPTHEEEIKVSSIPVEEVNVSLSLEKEVKVATTLYLEVATVTEKAVSVTPTHEEEAKVSPTSFIEEGTGVGTTPDVEEEAKIDPTLFHGEEANVTPTHVPEEDVTVTQTLFFGEESKVATFTEKVVSVAPTHEGEGEVAPTNVIEDRISVSTTPDIGEDVKVTPTLDTEEDAEVASTFIIDMKVASTPTLEEESKVDPSLVYDEENNVSTTLDHVDEAEDAWPTFLAGEGKVTSTPDHKQETNGNLLVVFEEEAEVTPSPDYEEEANGTLSGLLEGEAEFTPTFATEEVKTGPTIVMEEEANVTPTTKDFTLSPLSSQTSEWALLTNTTGHAASLKDVESSQKTTPTAASDLYTSTKTTSTAIKPISNTITTTTQWSRRTWSPKTTTPKFFHETAEPQKVTRVIPPVDHGLVDAELSLTQPPTLLILPNERAAVGGAGKSSDACMDDPCLNGGTCTERDGQIKCLCLSTYGGDLCQTDLERCEPGWNKFHGFCYRHFSQRLSWEVAEQHCRMVGAHLVSIMTPEEQDYINSNFKEYQWTGLNDKTIEDDFRWSDGNPLLYENWYRGQPDSYFLSGEDCVVMVWHDNGRWSDVPCNYHLAYTCKKGTSSCGPPPRVRNASIFGKARQRYETNVVVRFHCAEGFQQRFNPLIRCLPGGRWEKPQILCLPDARGPTQHPDVTSQTDSDFAAAENEFEATEETPQYWDIKF